MLNFYAFEKKIGLFGGTFNPIHYAHLRVAEEVRQSLSFDRILFIPSCYPPLKKDDLANSDDRASMVKLAIEGNPLFEVSDIECRGEGASYSLVTINKLREVYGDEKLFLILGLDAFLDIPNWYMPDSVVGSVDFVLLSRPPELFREMIKSPYIDISQDSIEKFERDKLTSYKGTLKSGKMIIFLKVTSLDISATLIRNLIRQGKSIKYLLPEKVESFIISKGLYK